MSYYTRRRSGAGFWSGVSVFLFVLAMVLGIAGLAYVWYRIMAPELGLQVPDFWAVFWSTLLVGVPLGLLQSVRSE